MAGHGEHERRESQAAPCGDMRRRGPGRRALSERELQVLGLLSSELSGPDIARALFISPNTLHTHSKHIFSKLDVNTRAAAVATALRAGLVADQATPR